jgi:CRISPR-associated endonuclease/helicase Cas3
MSMLRAEDFAAYFRAVHGVSPFPWQERLMAQVASEGKWPKLLDLPTGVGKTAAIDIAVFHRALDAGEANRRAPTRIVVVVDRRTIVDQAADRANKIREHLTKPDAPPILREVASRLGAVSVGGEPTDVLHVATLRGGMAREIAWARRPDQPTILVSTVDQVGSRLLFRGYGVSDSMRPIHAGLLGNDTLFLLDEVHLSEPFRQTLRALADRYEGWAERPLERRWQVVEMSATPASVVGAAFGLGADDRADETLRRRLEASKPIALLAPINVSGGEAARSNKFAEAVAAAALVDGHPAPGQAVGVVVNRVRTARTVFKLLTQMCGERARVLLVTGRMRPADRDNLQKELGGLVGAGRPDRNAGARSTIVVATQCIEAGADLDFDVLVTECASLDALKQRFGRLNRLGEAPGCRGVVVVRNDQLDSEDAVYGRALAETWAWLKAQGEAIDAGLNGPLASKTLPAQCLPERVDAPLMLPAHLDSWCQTNPIPEPDPEVALWLHGPRRDVAEVQLVWRADISEDELVDAKTDVVDSLKERLSLFPPSAGEGLSIPLHAARAWLERRADAASDFPDVPFGYEADAGQPDVRARPVLCWRGEDSFVTDVTSVAPGDTLIVPSTYGGLKDGNWDPSADAPVSDIADRLASTQRRTPALRLLPPVLGSDFGAVELPTVPGPASADADVTFDDAIDAWLDVVGGIEMDGGWSSAVIRSLRTRSRRRAVWVAHDWMDQSGASHSGYWALVARRRSDSTTEDDSSSFTGVAVPLDEHLQGVATWAGSFARGAGLPPDLVTAIEVAARWHDIGKADPRFQLLLHGGDAFKQALSPYLLAKSGAPAGDFQTRRKAAVRSGYPRGARHELMSLALLTSSDQPVGPPGIDHDLVFHLVASHHGYCRPLAPVALDPHPQIVEFPGPNGVLRSTSDHQFASLGSGVSTRFFRLIRRYGWHGLAWMEAILRLGDHRRSEFEQEAGGVA